MSTAKKLDPTPDEIYLLTAQKEGRATVQEVSMKALGKPDTAYQARVNHLNPDHVYRLDEHYKLDGKLYPVVIFLAVEGRTTRMILADGFHRHEVYRRRGLPAIRAYVIDVAMDRIEHEARLFASMCNQITILPRTDDDKRKAVELLFADSETRLWADSRIGNHCGVAPTTVKKYRADYYNMNNIHFPEKVIRSDGVIMKYTRDKDLCEINESSQCARKNPQFFKTIKGKKYYLGTSKEKAKIKLKEINDNIDSKKLTINRFLYDGFLASKGFSFNPCGTRGGNSSQTCLTGYHGHGLISVITRFDDSRDVSAAIGTLRMLRIKMNMHDARLVVLCYPEDGPQDLIELARQDGIEFFTPKGLVANLKGTEPEEEKEPEGDLPCT